MIRTSYILNKFTGGRGRLGLCVWILSTFDLRVRHVRACRVSRTLPLTGLSTPGTGRTGLQRLRPSWQGAEDVTAFTVFPLFRVCSQCLGYGHELTLLAHKRNVSNCRNVLFVILGILLEVCKQMFVYLIWFLGQLMNGVPAVFCGSQGLRNPSGSVEPGGEAEGLGPSSLSFQLKQPLSSLSHILYTLHVKKEFCGYAVL